MTSLSQLYQFAEDERIPVIPFPLPENGSVSMQADTGRCYIGIDESLLDTAAEERVHLAHELGHCATGSFYNPYAAYDIRKKHENRADKWAIQRIVPREELNTVIADGHTELWDLADYFDVTEDFMKKAIALYSTTK